ncbi:MAG: hypothetical protein OES26_09935 [Gammaproteobacteria bacterium]|nr:hypothetical protein [Gammaproteobacteria bacterium]
MIKEPDSNFDPPEDDETVEDRLERILSEDSELLNRAAKDAFASGRHRLGKSRKDLEDDDPGPVEDRDCDYWNRVT